MDNIQQYIDQAISIGLLYGPKIILAILVLIIGLWIIKKMVRVLSATLNKRGVDISLTSFSTSLIGIGMRALLIVSVAGMVGIQTTSFVAIIGAAGLAVGLALQGTLGNFAGGVLILLFRPYKVGDLIQTQGHLGNVKEIQIFVTILLTPENKTVIIPNGSISNGDITNYTTEGLIRVDLTFGISYKANIKTARTALMEVMNAHPKVLQKPLPFVGVSELGDSAINLAVRPYTNPQDYWEVYFDIYEQGKEALDNANVEIPFPQIDVHFDQAPNLIGTH